MKRVGNKREELRRRKSAAIQSSKKFQWWGIAIGFIGIGLAIGGFKIGVFIYFFGFGLLIFALLSQIIAWRLHKKIKGS
jgi:hypothetical protein